jgi:uncharacterized protein YgfB (UPF0149 family)
VVDFDTLADLLLSASLQRSPAELHGCLTGQICVGAALTPDIALALLAESYQIQVGGEVGRQLTQLYQSAQSSLEQGFDFQLLLPDADAELTERVSELGCWCQSFLDGFAQAFALGGGPGPNASDVAELREVLEDFAAIAQAGLDDSSAGNDSEQDFLELEEYVRLAAVNVYLELSTPEPIAEGGESDAAIGGPSGLFGGKLHR